MLISPNIESTRKGGKVRGQFRGQKLDGRPCPGLAEIQRTFAPLNERGAQDLALDVYHISLISNLTPFPI